MRSSIKTWKKYRWVVIISTIIISLTATIALLNKRDEVTDEGTSNLVMQFGETEKYLIGVERDVSFEIQATQDFVYKVEDSAGNQIDTRADESGEKIKLLAPDALYQEGETYKLEISGGEFVQEELKSAKIVIFTVKRKSEQQQEYQDNIKRVSSDEVKVNETTLETDLSLENGQILIVEKNDEPISAYKIIRSQDGSYQYEIPALDEVYKRFDYYGYEEVDYSNVALVEDLQQFVTSEVGSLLIDQILGTKTAYAKPKLDVSLQPTVGKGLTFSFDLELEEKESILGQSFLDSTSTHLAFDLTFRIKLFKDYLEGGEIEEVDKRTNVFVGVEVKFTPKVKFTYKDPSTEIFNKEMLDVLENSLAIYKKVTKYDKQMEDRARLTLPLLNGIIPTSIPGMQIVSKITGLAEVGLKASLSMSHEFVFDAYIGYNPKYGIYYNFKREESAETELDGKITTKIGVGMSIGLNTLNVASLSLDEEMGVYGEGGIEIKDKSEESKQITTVKLVRNVGTFVDLGVTAKAGVFNKELKLLDGDNNGKIKIFDKDEELARVEEDAPRYTAGEIRKLLNKAWNDGPGQEWDWNGRYGAISHGGCYVGPIIDGKDSGECVVELLFEDKNEIMTRVMIMPNSQTGNGYACDQIYNYAEDELVETHDCSPYTTKRPADAKERLLEHMKYVGLEWEDLRGLRQS